MGWTAHFVGLSTILLAEQAACTCFRGLLLPLPASSSPDPGGQRIDFIANLHLWAQALRRKHDTAPRYAWRMTSLRCNNCGHQFRGSVPHVAEMPQQVALMLTRIHCACTIGRVDVSAEPSVFIMRYGSTTRKSAVRRTRATWLASSLLQWRSVPRVRL
jgi:hypothetical protein